MIRCKIDRPDHDSDQLVHLPCRLLVSNAWNQQCLCCCFQEAGGEQGKARGGPRRAPRGLEPTRAPQVVKHGSNSGQKSGQKRSMSGQSVVKRGLEPTRAPLWRVALDRVERSCRHATGLVAEQLFRRNAATPPVPACAGAGAGAGKAGSARCGSM